MFEQYKDLMTVEDITDALSICKTTAYRLLSDNRIEHVRIRGSIRIPKKAFEKYILEDVPGLLYHRAATKNGQSSRAYQEGGSL